MNWNIFWHIAGVLNLATLTIVGVISSYWIFFESDPITVDSGRAVTPTVVRGGELIVAYFGTKHRSDCTAKSKYFIEDSRKKKHEFTGLSNFNRIGSREIQYHIAVPIGAAPGKAHFWEFVVYTCNPLRDHPILTPKISFTIS